MVSQWPGALWTGTIWKILKKCEKPVANTSRHLWHSPHEVISFLTTTNSSFPPTRPPPRGWKTHPASASQATAGPAAERRFGRSKRLETCLVGLAQNPTVEVFFGAFGSWESYKSIATQSQCSWTSCGSTCFSSYHRSKHERETTQTAGELFHLCST